MARIARILINGTPQHGLIEDDVFRLVEGDIFSDYHTTDTTVTLDNAHWLSPVEPRQFLGLWNNLEHRRIAENNFTPKFPLYFIKLLTSVAAHKDAIRRPPGFEGLVKYEAEIGIVIGKECFQVSEDEVDDYVLGYTCVNDVTAPEPLFEEEGFTHWCRAKSFPTFGPFGPCIATDVEPEDLIIKGILDGELKQDYAVADMIYSPRQIVSLISQEARLLPGDVITCGTGVGAVTMEPGQVIEVEIDGIGRLTNRYIG